MYQGNMCLKCGHPFNLQKWKEEQEKKWEEWKKREARRESQIQEYERKKREESEARELDSRVAGIERRERERQQVWEPIGYGANRDDPRDW